MRIAQQTSWLDLRSAVDELHKEALTLERHAGPLLEQVHPGQRPSAINLLHYLALRRRDHGELQAQLAAHGLSSLGRSESHVLATIEAVLGLLDTVTGKPTANLGRPATLTQWQGEARLQAHADRLFGPAPDERRVRIMVTLSREQGEDRAQIEELLRRGMDCARINAAHDDLFTWRRMARHVREASRLLGRPCRIAVDLPGPKCRTGALQRGPEVLKLRPQRGPSGEVLRPATAWLSENPGDEHRPLLPVSAAFLATLSTGSILKLRDARGRRRRWHVGEIADTAVEIWSNRTSYVQRGTVLSGPKSQGAVGPLEALEQLILLRDGDLLAVTRAATPGHPARAAYGSELASLATIPCEPPELVDMVRVGEAVWLDDGRIGGVVDSLTAEGFLVRIGSARPQGDKLRAGKGINLPDTKLTMPAFTELDEEALTFAAEAADIVSLSFLRDPADVHEVQKRLAALGRPELALILKIETREGFDRLPELLLAALRSETAGVMIARGDLAVECGFERLAEVQEEILWLCEAAHVPVVWATQVLETLAKTGRATRAEVSDAALAERAECVMLNKGAFITQAVTSLDDILRRMKGHQDKKSALFRALGVALAFSARLEPQSVGGDQPKRRRSTGQ